jgi:hypothetical protein
MYEELETLEIRLFSLRKELLLLSATDFKEYELVGDGDDCDLSFYEVVHSTETKLLMVWILKTVWRTYAICHHSLVS